MIVTLDREDFLAAVLPVIRLGNVHPTHAAELERVARRMDRFPMGSWFSPRAACGCIVGEGFRRGLLPRDLSVAASATMMRTYRVNGHPEWAPAFGPLDEVGHAIDAEVQEAVADTLGWDVADDRDGLETVDLVVIVDGATSRAEGERGGA